MKLTYVIAARNQREALVRTLERLAVVTGLPEHAWEAVVVDNASQDGGADAAAQVGRHVRVISLAENEGVPARNLGIREARGRYVLLLDPGVVPEDGTVARCLAYLARHPKTAALTGRVELPDGTSEAPALPTVLFGAATIARKSALDETGGFAPEFFRQAADYDLSFRLWGAGWRIERFEDVRFRRTSTAQGQASAMAFRMDLRNNLILAERYLPRPLRKEYRRDWARRYAALALSRGYERDVNAALKEARVWAKREAVVGRRTLRADTIESIFQLESQQRSVTDWARQHGVRRVCIADVSKNLYATWRGCRAAGLEVMALLDSRPGFAGGDYRGTPIVSDAGAAPPPCDGIVVSNISPAQAPSRAASLALRTDVPVLRLWHPRTIDAPGELPRKVEAA